MDVPAMPIARRPFHLSPIHQQGRPRQHVDPAKRSTRLEWHSLHRDENRLLGSDDETRPQLRRTWRSHSDTSRVVGLERTGRSLRDAASGRVRSAYEGPAPLHSGVGSAVATSAHSSSCASCRTAPRGADDDPRDSESRTAGCYDMSVARGDEAPGWGREAERPHGASAGGDDGLGCDVHRECPDMNVGALSTSRRRMCAY